MQMTDNEIVKSYKKAQDRRKQIRILAELNLCTKEDIRIILRKAGCDVPQTGNRYTAAKKTEETEASGSKRKRLIKNEESTECSDLSTPGEVGTHQQEAGTMSEKKAETNCSECKNGETCGAGKPDGIKCDGFEPKGPDSSNLRSRIPEEVAEATRNLIKDYEFDIGDLQRRKANIDDEISRIQTRLKDLKEWLLKTGCVLCSSCGHLVTKEVQGQAAPVCICDAEIWRDKEEGPHIIKHDTEKPILCDYWKEKEGGTEA